MIKILLISLILGLVLVYLRHINSEIYNLALIGAGIIIIFISLNYINDCFNFFNAIISYTGVKEEYYYLILKMICIGYLTEFTCSTLEDINLTSLSYKINFLCKIIILSLSLPIIKEVFNIVVNFLK